MEKIIIQRLNHFVDVNKMVMTDKSLIKKQIAKHPIVLLNSTKRYK